MCGPFSYEVLELNRTWWVTTASGAVYDIVTGASAGGGYMAGGGYGGHHGKSLGRERIESEVYPIDGSVTQRTLDSSLTDRLCAFVWDGRPGSAIFVRVEWVLLVRLLPDTPPSGVASAS
ncbi:hypothetical protein [Rhodococcus sp. T7]|uniref:hypothetical protein n=1 Tax=Rhodococcus sp. T7 TaxID=627444 RepID=UPI0013C641FE|nr:hypothetical protein [Rhodococcus sp. T7]KAF0957168.1 hypothetical protein MLGJGCBP_08998 [Rhodococcus sp. T7]KAF0959006.1 hypothetical protein MLGJGCBP_07883 [Rhodococcus sp. T7]